MPSFSQPFRLAVLPKILSLSNVETQISSLQIADDFSLESNKITIGISGSTISQYIINPTPSLVFNVPIPSTNNVTACNIGHFVSDTDGSKLECWAYGLSYNKNHTLNISIKTSDDDKYATSGGEVVETYSQKCDDKIEHIKINEKEKVIVVVLKNGLIQFYDFTLKLLKSVNVMYSDISFVEHFEEDGKQFAIILSNIEGKKISFKLYELFTNDKTSINELSSTILEDADLGESQICYQFGKIYRLFEDRLYIYNLPQCQLQQTIELPFIQKKDSDVLSFSPIANNRILLTVNNKIYLLDLVHNSILAERDLSHVKVYQLLKSIVVPSKGENKNSKTIAIGVSIKNGPSPISSLEVINVDVGSGTLKDSLGKSFQVANVKKNIPLQSLFPEDETIYAKGEQKSFDYKNILQELQNNKNDINKFDDIFFKKLNIMKEYYTEQDRFIYDQKFLSDVLDLIFSAFKKDYPRALTFLLTHPLFPISHTRNLLTKFRNQPRLFKQAVVTCPNLPLKELLAELFTITNGELCLDISLRILQDYTRDSIKQELKTLSKVDIQNFIEFVIDTDSEDKSQFNPQLFQLLSLVLDASGLFALEEETLEKLSAYIDNQVNVAERNNRLWHLLDENSDKRSTLNQANDQNVLQTKSLSAYSVEYLEL
ncbi:hypothetical protein Kpol_480p16 [Vanderwaltozyma polyspora DSM 70294]|uniref:U3 small nucleolar RNA-associated protein 8 n=1 Tax=Vanderwaltozyma polyspora (strain ATCC 22028 / DSM 70294 / BCRC 21397 / CBS 2163 / NBRC 10782 / NRRL Y-8283 / UCD 57-17) TaxID=436907 RepID=A7TP78_VANPO|nr:uncharacterized protein Kpol_480p16 [Vanderwaltozyma polyspora DSM 70294]EDO15929.1 hypothetical protein Kpol_480p16 [Vanderwaltozyma polyspora DSM 70294]